ncbi:MAG: hypothetical protein ABS81_11535 [Pseudonocardia sp. SCN 72-86]|nr:MAG: hypothetical protein ABS81_11535 [Pseudonocardia sp. SCN 72-86]
MESATPQAQQGEFLDPIDLPPLDVDAWDPACRDAFSTPEMGSFVDALRRPGADGVRDAVLGDLGDHYGMTPDQARDACLNWEETSVDEWRATNASESDAGRVEFYRTTTSWSFDLSWWAYLQSEGRADPSNVMAFRFAQQHSPGRRHLDFGSGIGVTSQLFVRNGWTSTCADLSSTLLDFARFRHERRDDVVSYIDLHNEQLPAGAYDAITAIDTLAHVPDVHASCRALHAALGPDGILVANFDIRAAAPETAWHLYDDDLRPVFDLRRAGFVPIGDAGYGMVGYRKVRNQGIRHGLRTLAAWVTLVSPPRRLARAASRPLLRGLGRLRSTIRSSDRDEAS